ncbi:MAG: response regulator [Candidatus Accumulibacter sp.]|jgi:twitching motility two-component system response regulator PilH|nr:response regulator [Accumulibacter sp.]
MSFLEQIRSILDNGPPPVEKEFFHADGDDRRRRKRFSHKGRRILVVDDSATVVATFGKLLGSAGCLVRDAFDAETGLEIARGERPDLVFLDIVLPGMNGFAALRHMRRDPLTRRIPVIVISGNEQAIEQFYAKRIGADDFMRKPFSRGELFTHVEMLVVKEKLPRIETAASATPSSITSSSTTPSPATSPMIVDPTLPELSAQDALHAAAAPREEKVLIQKPRDLSIAGMTPLEARHRLSSMGLEYASQEQFSAAKKRKDRLAVQLFVIGRGIKV